MLAEAAMASISSCSRGTCLKASLKSSIIPQFFPPTENLSPVFVQVQFRVVGEQRQDLRQDHVHTTYFLAHATTIHSS